MASEEDMLHQGQLEPLCFASIIVNAIFVQNSLHANRGCYHQEARHAPHEWLGMGEDSLSPLVPQKERAFLLHEISFSSWTQKASPLSCPAASAMPGAKPCQVELVDCGWQWVFQQLHSWAHSAHSYLQLILRKSLGLVPPKKKGSRLEAPVRESWQEDFQLYSHLLRAMVHTTVIYEPLWHSGRLCYWWVWGTFHVRFYILHKLLRRVSLGLPCYGFAVSLLELMISSCLVWIDFYDTGTKR